MKNKFPIIDIEGTAFIIDVVKEELREKTNSRNIINIKEMFYDGHGYHFDYDTRTKNLATFEAVSNFLDDIHIKRMSIPNLTDLAPHLMAQKYNKTIKEVTGKTDFELTIKEGSFFDLRWNKKILPTLKIAGNTFFVDTAADKLRPKDDFLSKGINFTEIKDYYDRTIQAYIIPYNPKTHEFQEIDHLKIMELPKDIIIVKFPHHQELDRVGWNLKHGFGPAHCISESLCKMHFKAVTLPWEETNIPHSIKLNLEAKYPEKTNKSQADKLTDLPSQVKKGRNI